jgi:hypothetical protein
MASGCGVDYAEAAKDAETLTIGGVAIPVPSLETLIQTKNTIRPSDAADRRLLEESRSAASGE